MIVCNSISGSLKNVVRVATSVWGEFLYSPPFSPPQFKRAMKPNTLKSISIPPKNILFTLYIFFKVRILSAAVSEVSSARSLFFLSGGHKT